MPIRSWLVYAALASVFAVGCQRDPEHLKLQYVQRGDSYASKKQYSEAIVEYRRAVQIAPKYGEARKELAEAYAATGEVRNALPEYVRAADLLPEDSELQLKAGSLLLLGGRFQDAKTRARTVLKRDPKDFRALVLLGNALAGLRAIDDAVDVAQRAAELVPDRAGLLTNLGTLRLAKGDRDLAEQAFQRAVDLADGHVPPYLALANFYRSGGRLAEAERVLEKVYQLEPRNTLVNQAFGSFLVEANRAGEAERYFKAAADIAQDSSARLALADYYLATKRFSDAASLLNGLTNDKVVFGVAKMRLAVVQLASGLRTEAFQSIADVLARAPRDATAMSFKARLLLSDYRIDEADAVIRTALAIDPRSAQVQIMLGRVRVAQNQLEAARKAFNDALDLEPYGIDAAMELARLHMQRGEMETSISFAERSVRNQPEGLEPRLTLIRTLMVRSEDYPRAETELRAMLTRFPAQPRVHAAWGNLRMMSRDPAGARAAYMRALQLDPNSVDALSGLLVLDASSNRIADAVKRINERLAMSPTDPSLLMLGARTALIVRDSSKAEQLLKSVIKADPGRLEAYVMLGEMYVVGNRLPAAIEEFQQLSSVDSQSIPAATMLGLLFNAQNKIDQAQKWFEHAAQIDPRAAAVASNNLAWMYAEGRGSLDQALQYARYAVSQTPEQPSFNDTLGWVLYKKKMIADSINAFRVSVNIEPGNPDFQYHIGLAYAASGDDAQARRALEEALRLAPNFSGAADAREILKTLVY